MAFDSTSGSIVDARAVSGPAKGILGDAQKTIFASAFASRIRLKLLHCMYTVVRISDNRNKAKDMRPSFVFRSTPGPVLPAFAFLRVLRGTTLRTSRSEAFALDENQKT